MATPQTGAGDPKRSLELLWRSFGPQQSRPGPKPKLTVDRIVEAAITVADREGSCFGMRSVAAELGVGAMTIYRYVPGKRELIDLMVDRLSRLGPDAPDLSGTGWREGLEMVAESTWQVYSDHPWLLEINQRRPVLGPDSLEGYDFVLAAFKGHDLPDKEINLAVTAMMNMVTGTARQYLIRDSADEEPATAEEEWWHTQAPYLERAVASGRYKNIARFTSEEAWEITGHEAMRYAVDRFLDGLAPRMEASRKALPALGGAGISAAGGRVAGAPAHRRSPGRTNPDSYAMMTASVRLRAPSLVSTEPTWVFTVSRPRNRRVAMAWFDSPSATSRSTSASRGVSATGPCAFPGGGACAAASARIDSGNSSAPPATTRTARAIWAMSARLSTNPLAPQRSAS